MTGGAGLPLYAGIAAGAATGALTNKNNRLLGAITGGLGGYSGFGIGSAAKAAGAAVPKSIAATTPYKGGFVNPEVATGTGFGGAATTGADLAQNANILNNANQFGLTNSSLAGASAGMPIEQALATSQPIGMANVFNSTASTPTYMGNLSTAGRGVGEIFSGNQAAIDAYTKAIGADSAMGALGKTMLPVGGAAVFGGLEESDIYGKPMQRAEAEKYDPYARLDLGTDTGLRLVAKGGYINGYATGGTVQSGGIRDLYGTPDNPPSMSSGLGGFGLGRLNNLANEQAMSQAQTLGYAEGGVASLELPDPSKTAPAPENLESMIINETAKTEMLANQLNNLTSNALNTGNIPTQNYAPGALSNIAAGMQNQPLPPQASFIQNLTSARTGYDEGGSVEGSTKGITTAEGIASIDPSRVRGDMVDDMAGLPYTYDRIITPGALDFYTLPSQEYNPETYARALRKPEGMARGGYLNGQGDGMSDSIPATIEGKQPARLADGEFVIPADVVSHLGNGSSKAGSKRLYAMLDKVRKARTGNKKQGKQINPSKYMPA
jgi:hypothetical protein